MHNFTPDYAEEGKMTSSQVTGRKSTRGKRRSERRAPTNDRPDALGATVPAVPTDDLAANSMYISRPTRRITDSKTSAEHGPTMLTDELGPMIQAETTRNVLVKSKRYEKEDEGNYFLESTMDAPGYDDDCSCSHRSERTLRTLRTAPVTSTPRTSNRLKGLKSPKAKTIDERVGDTFTRTLPRIKLIYFDPLTAISCQRMLRIGLIPYQDNHMDSKHWQDLGNPKTCALVINKKAVWQTTTVLRYLARLTSLYPSDPLDRLICDELLDDIRACKFSMLNNEETLVERGQTAGQTGQTITKTATIRRKAGHGAMNEGKNRHKERGASPQRTNATLDTALGKNRQPFATAVSSLPIVMRTLNKAETRLVQGGTGHYIGKQLTIADLEISALVQWIIDARLSDVPPILPFDYPQVMSIHKHVVKVDSEIHKRMPCSDRERGMF